MLTLKIWNYIIYHIHIIIFSFLTIGSYFQQFSRNWIRIIDEFIRTYQSSPSEMEKFFGGQKI